MVAAAVIGGAVVGGVASSISSGNAADAQTSAANQANQTELAQYAQTRADLSPYNTAGQSALSTLQSNNYYNNPLTLPQQQSTMTQSQLEQTPGYQFNLSQGLKATQNAAAARGLGVSGAALKGASTYATGLADSTYQNQFNNQQTLFNNAQQIYSDQAGQQTNNYNRLMGTASLGENAAATTGNVGQATANQVSSNTVGAGNANAASDIATGNAITSTGNTASNLYLTNSLLQSNGGKGLFS